MTYKQANQLVRELTAEQYFTSVYTDALDRSQPTLGYKVVAVVSEDRRVVEEVHHINADRSYPQYI